MAKRQSLDNPVYYVQYAHARIASILRKAQESGRIDPRDVSRGVYAAGGAEALDALDERDLALAAKLGHFPAVIELASALFFVFALSQVVDGLQSTLVGALRGLSDTAVPSLISILAYWPVAIPLGWALAFPLGWGPQGIWIGFVSALALAAIALIWRFNRLTRLPG